MPGRHPLVAPSPGRFLQQHAYVMFTLDVDLEGVPEATDHIVLC